MIRKKLILITKLWPTGLVFTTLDVANIRFDNARDKFNINLTNFFDLHPLTG